MRILQVNSAQRLGGGEVHVGELSSKLRQSGHHVQIAGRLNGPLNPDITLPFRNSADFISAFQLRRVLREERIEVVHAHVARDYTIVAAAAWRVPNLAVILTRHLLYPIKPNALYRRVDGWLAPTTEISGTLAPLKPKRSAVIPNWVDLRKFTFRPHDLHIPVNLGILGQISPHKGHEDAIECLRILGSGFRLLVAGTGTREYIELFQQRAQGLPVEFMGFSPASAFFQSVDILLMPSWLEPFGIVLLEAMASGIPVIATARGGPLDIIRSGEHGLLVAPQKPGDLAAAVRQIVDSPSLRLALVQRARTRVESDFDSDKVIPRIEQFYSESLAGCSTQKG